MLSVNSLRHRAFLRGASKGIIPSHEATLRMQKRKSFQISAFSASLRESDLPFELVTFGGSLILPRSRKERP